MFINEGLLEKAKEAYKKMKAFGIIVSIIMIILGIVLFVVPEGAPALALWFMMAGLFIKGISDIVFFCKLPKGAKDGWLLAGGIIWVVLGILLLVFRINANIFQQLIAWGSFEMVLGFMVGFTSIFSGIKFLCDIGEVKAMGGPIALNIIAGILGILLGILILSYPIGAIITLTIFYGCFLLVGGISLLCRTLSY